VKLVDVDKDGDLDILMTGLRRLRKLSRIMILKIKRPKN